MMKLRHMTPFVLGKLENKKENAIPIEFCVCTIDLMKQGCMHTFQFIWENMVLGH